MQALKAKNPDIQFSGIGGEKMEAQGLTSLFDMKQLSVMGFFEVLPHVPKFIKLINTTAKTIIETKPDILITIDAPDFCFRVAKKVKEQTERPKLVHVVAPSVWAYRPKRAAKIAAIYDHLLTLLPFEPPYFEREGLAATFIGHPLTEEGFDKGDRESFRKKYKIEEKNPVALIMPGSRASEVNRLFEVFAGSLKILKARAPTLEAVVVSTPRFFDKIKTETAMWPVKTRVVTGEEKKDAYKAADFGIIKSGTSSVEVAIAGLPMVVAYKVSPLSALLAKMLLKTKFVSLVNIILGREAVPELLQENCTSEKIAMTAGAILKEENKRLKQKESFKEALASLKPDGEKTPSQKAAEVILSL